MVEEEVDLSVISRVGKFNPDFMAPISRTTRTFIEQKDENTVSKSCACAVFTFADLFPSFGYPPLSPPAIDWTIPAVC